MSKFKSALTRKFGPLPAWAWAVIGFIGIWYYRNRIGAVSGSASNVIGTTGTTSDQPPITLGPGESVYDPNTGTLHTAPGQTTDDSTGAPSSDPVPGQTMPDYAPPIGYFPPGTPDPFAPDAPAPAASPTTPTSVKPKPRHPVGSKAGPHGAIWAPSGRHKPPARKGFHTIGVGKGGWIYAPDGKGGKRSATPKPGSKPSTHKGATTHPSTKQGRSRSTANVRNGNGGRTKSATGLKSAVINIGRGTVNVKAPTPGKRASTPAAKPPPRQQAKTPANNPVVRKRPVAANTPKKAAAPPAPAPRPSAPPPRTVARAPAP